MDSSPQEFYKIQMPYPRRRKKKEDLPPPSARRRVMDLIAKRDHSERELRKKLKEKEYEAADIDDAIEFARENNWLVAPDKLSERVAAGLHRRSRGIRAINHKLKEKGLPTVSTDPEVELEKALKLAQTKLAKLTTVDRAARERIGRFLISRGFETSIVRKVVYEKL